MTPADGSAGGREASLSLGTTGHRFLASLLLFVGCAAEAPVDRLAECAEEAPDVAECEVSHDLDAIVESGVLRVALAADPTSWFLDGRRVRGFEYDVLHQFARSKGLQLRLYAEPTVSGRLAGLQEGRYDVVAGRMSRVAGEGFELVPLAETRRVIVQSVEDVLVNGAVESLEDLDGRVVHAVTHSGNALAVGELGLDVQIERAPDGMRVETLLEQLPDLEGVAVVRADLAAPLADEHNLVIGPALPGSAPVMAAVRGDAPALAMSLENWLDANEVHVHRAQERYLEQRVQPREPHVSEFDPLFRAHAERIDWSWTLLAAQAWQESKFRPTARSHAGAIGLMQIMPATAGELGIDPHDPAQSVKGAADYLRRLDRYYGEAIPDEDARLPFVLAAYNAGMGHVDDARRLAEHNGADPSVWDQVAPWLLALQDRAWSRHEVVKYGFCRGSEPVAYVQSVLDRRAIYEALLDAASAG